MKKNWIGKRKRWEAKEEKLHWEEKRGSIKKKIWIGR